MACVTIRHNSEVSKNTPRRKPCHGPAYYRPVYPSFCAAIKYRASKTVPRLTKLNITMQYSGFAGEGKGSDARGVVHCTDC